MKRFNFIIITLLVVFVLLIVEVIIVKNAADYEPELSIVFAKTRIPEETVIQADMLEEKKVALSMAHKLSVKSMKDIIGKRAKLDIEAGEVLLSSKAITDTEFEKINVKDKNNRLFSVEFKADQANGWWLAADQYVDLIFVPNEKSKVQSGILKYDLYEKDNKILPQVQAEQYVQRLKNIRIAAIIDETGKLVKNSDKTSKPKYISFEVTDKQDEFLARAKMDGKIEISVIP